MKKAFLLALLSTGFWLAAAAQAALPPKYALPDSAPCLPGRLVFCLRAGSPPLPSLAGDPSTGLGRALQGLKGTAAAPMFPHAQTPAAPTDALGQRMADLSRIYVASYSGPLSPALAARLLAAAEEVEWAEPWYLHETFYQPNDAFADTLDGLDLMWHLDQVQARQAWGLQQGNSQIVVGIVDSGTEGAHPDLQANRAINVGDPLDGLDNDQDGYVDNRFGWDFAGSTAGGIGDNNPSVGNVHGLWVTGIIGATADNGIGIPGMSFNCGYLPVKAAPDDSIGLISHGYQGIVYAVDQGAQVVNCSWGGSVSSQLGAEVIRYATVNKGACVVAACGNSTSDRKFYPAAYERVISVANSYFGDTLCCNSTYNYTVDLSAPGWGIRSTFGSDNYWSWSGTSAAAPVVASAVALTLAHFPQLSGFQAGQRVRVTTDDTYAVNGNWLDKMGTGRVNFYQALAAPQRPSVRLAEYRFEDKDGDGRLSAGDTLQLLADFINHLAPASALQIHMELPGFQEIVAEVIESDRVIGAVSSQQRFQAQLPFRLRLRENIPFDYVISLRIAYRDTASGYEDFEYIEQRVNPSYLDIRANALHSSVNSQGNFGFNDFILNEQGLGVRYRGFSNALFEGGFLLGRSPVQVSDRIRNPLNRDNDFALVSAVEVLENGPADLSFETHFDDRLAAQPLNLSVTQRGYAFADSADADYLIFEYRIRNDLAAPQSGVLAGLFADWDIAPYADPASGSLTTRNACDYRMTEKLVYARDLSGSDPNYYGMALLSGQEFRAYATVSGSPFSFNTSSKYLALNSLPGASSTAGGSTGADIMHFISGGPMSLGPLETDTVAFALLGGSSLADLLQNLAQARVRYRCDIENRGPNRLFSVSDTLAAPGALIFFSDQNPGAQQWSWDFGNGAQAVGPAPAYSYAQPGLYEVQLTVSDGICTSVQRRSIRVEAGQSIAPGSPLRWRLSPNPAGASAEASGLAGIRGELRLYNALGQELRRQALDGSERQALSLEGLPAGIYLVQLHSPEGFSAQRLEHR
jgi:hypothetical protein